MSAKPILPSGARGLCRRQLQQTFEVLQGPGSLADDFVSVALLGGGLEFPRADLHRDVPVPMNVAII